ncbi:MAG: HDIG domain-containing metalloprotein [Balneolales bacterium]
MSILEKLGLGRKKRPPLVYNSGKRKKDEQGTYLSEKKYIKPIISLLFLVLLIVLYPRTNIQDVNVQIGEPWRDSDLTAQFTFSLIKDEDEIEEEVEQVETYTVPIFHKHENADIRIQARVDSLFRSFTPVLEGYAAWKKSKAGETETVREDSVAFVRQLEQSGIGLNDSGWKVLLDDYARIKLQEAGGRNPVTSEFIGIDIRLKLEQIIAENLNNGVINVPKSELNLSEITVRNQQDRTERSYSVQNVRDRAQSREYARFSLSNQLEEGPAGTAYQLFTLVMEPNLIYNEEETQARINDGLDEISPTKGAVAAGQVIIRRGDLITTDKYTMLESLAIAQANRATDLERWQRYLGEALVLLTIFIVFFMYIYLYRRNIYENNAMFLLVFLVISLVCTASALLGSMEGFSPYMIPVALAPIILTIIFDSRVGLMTTMTVALITAFMHGNNFEYVFATMVACSLAVYSVRDIKNSSQFYLTTPVLLYASYIFVLFAFTMTKLGGWGTFMNNLGLLVPNAMGIWLTAPLIWLIERTFKVTTDVTLLELSDTNRPVLKDLMNRAPGTFHHSLQVANLSEAAAASIGANSLMCRVGGLYHDIGKLDKPDYYVENQSGRNEHDKLKPRMSALVIKNHVSKGVKMAYEISLPEVLIDFIRMHHGTSLIRFFYDKASQQPDNKQEVQEEDFRYDGPIPNTKETGILLLADGVEAASRAMTDPSYSKLENLVNRLVEERMAEGQLNNCSLTFQNLTIIKESFLKILVGMYHGRVKYPDQDKHDRAVPGEKGENPEKPDHSGKSVQAEKPAGNERPGSEEEQPDEKSPTQVQ